MRLRCSGVRVSVTRRGYESYSPGAGVVWGACTVVASSSQNTLMDSMGRPNSRAKDAARPVAVDLFAGAGGLSLGAERAGFDVLAAVEYDPIHAAAHEFNFPHTEVVCANAKNVSGETVKDAVRKGWAAHSRAGEWGGSIEAVFGGPPCQGFSVGGLWDSTDDRNEMVFEFARLVGELRPRYFVMENVPGLQGFPDPEGDEERLLYRLILQLEFVGYEVTPPFVLNAALFGAPQDRRRLFLMGAMPGEEVPQVPAPTVRPVPKRRGDKAKRGHVGHPDADADLPIGPTVWDAIGDLPNADDYDGLWKSDAHRLKVAEAKRFGELASTYGRALRGVGDASDLSRPRNWDSRTVTSSMRTGHQLKPRQRMDKTAQGEYEAKSRLYRLDSEGLCPTLRAGSGYDRGSYTAPRPIHPRLPRVITVREAARLHSFPDWFRLHPTKWHGFRQVGNALPPLLGQAVAAEIIRGLGVSPARPTTAIDLGDPVVLGAGMLDAAEHFGADPETVPGNHTRVKSGGEQRLAA
jgi:DNA (cytosine-5)-methyltransferase 1